MIDVGAPGELEQLSAPREIVGQEPGEQPRIGLGLPLLRVPVPRALLVGPGIPFFQCRVPQPPRLAFGLLVSTLVRTQQQAIQASFGFMLPNILLSGFMFPRQAMPEIAQWLGLLMPLTYFLKVVRGILLKGVGLEALWQEVLILAAFAVVLIVASVRRFRKTLD